MAADASSRVFYNRVKGEPEDALSQLPFEGLVIARPSFLTGDRESLGQPDRPLETAFLLLSKVAGPLIPAKYRPIAATQVAQALVACRNEIQSYRITGEKTAASWQGLATRLSRSAD